MNARSRNAATRGFTLLELMIVLAVIGVLASIMVPKFATVIRRANEGSTRAKLGSLRKALVAYYIDNGDYPATLDPLLAPGSKYIAGPVPLYTHEHGQHASVVVKASRTFGDSGEWGYASTGPDAGQIWIECTHTDMKGAAWTSY